VNGPNAAGGYDWDPTKDQPPTLKGAIADEEVEVDDAW
jgi:hypothetical protein